MIFIFAANTFAANEGIAHRVNKYAHKNPGEDRCCSGCDDLYTADNVTDGFLDWLDAIGYSDIVKHYNKGVDAKDFSDHGRVSWGRDHIDDSGTDYANLVLYSCLGYCENTWGQCVESGSGDFSAFVMGEAQDTCYPLTTKCRCSHLMKSPYLLMTYLLQIKAWDDCL